jgi:DNA-directed RNA polymerase subunit RPC12/RpoP
LLKAAEMTFLCKKCKKAFRKDAAEFEDADEYCPHCDNKYVIQAVEPKMKLEVEGEDVRVDARMLRDERVRSKSMEREIDKLLEDKLG